MMENGIVETEDDASRGKMMRSSILRQRQANRDLFLFFRCPRRVLPAHISICFWAVENQWTNQTPRVRNWTVEPVEARVKGKDD